MIRYALFSTKTTGAMVSYAYPIPSVELAGPTITDATLVSVAVSHTVTVAPALSAVLPSGIALPSAKMLKD